LDACGVDDIEDTGDIAILVRTLDTGDASTVGGPTPYTSKDIASMHAS